MNIFFVSDCPKECARHLDDKRVVKMVLETAQMLSTAINELGGKAPYKSTHVNHPSNKWVRESRGNYEWLLKHFYALCDEYTARYNKIHSCDKYRSFFRSEMPQFKRKCMTDKPNCAGNASLGISYKDVEDIHAAYRCYLSDRWMMDKRKPTWYKQAYYGLH